MKYLSVVIGVLLAWVMVVCTQTVVAQEGVGAEVLIERTYAIADVDALSIGGRGTMEITFGDQERLEITAGKRVLERIKVDAKGNELRIHHKAKFWGGNDYDRLSDKTHYRLVLKRLHKINVSGVMSVAVAAGIKSRHVTLNMSGPSVINISDLAHVEHLSVNTSGPSELSIGGASLNVLSLQMSGPTRVELAGKTAQAKINMSGPSKLLAAAFKASQASVGMSGPSNATLTVEQALNASLSGLAKLDYYGEAKVQSNVTGSSHVRHLSAESAMVNKAQKDY
ncbi:GIN domain-containing protein [Marinagarivorans algicola]|uniref:GIN domain-containing protein n=1 Tax=Marinagarivorans algicola TaxID=1513270 RepID=UPI00373652B8